MNRNHSRWIEPLLGREAIFTLCPSVWSNRNQIARRGNLCSAVEPFGLSLFVYSVVGAGAGLNATGVG